MKTPSKKNDARIAIIGMGCRFPGEAISPAEYWKMLKEGGNANREIPQERWSLERFYSPDHEAPGKAYVRRGCFLNQRIDQFDAAFFGMSPREAMLLDPQQRLLLEVAWEAFEDSGVIPEKIRGSNTGVYIGGFTMDNQIHLLNVLNRNIITTHTATGSTLTMLSNRLSYIFDLHGPSLSVDTACSSSMVTLHLACQAILQGECELALSGGVNVMLRPEYTIAMCKGGFLAPDGLCKAFDASGDGYGRGEGAGIVILKSLSKALQDGDPIRAIILATGINQDGRTDGITLPNGAAQKALIGKVHSKAGIQADDIQYVEAHGTGTRAGDSAEAHALGEALASRRFGEESLWLGSVKTNIGHLEAASGVASIIKTVLALENKLIPPNLHFREPRPDIDFAMLRLRIPTTLEDWPKSSGPACAAINSFGYGGTNAHTILQTAPPQKTFLSGNSRRPTVFPISAASRIALTTKVQQFIQFLDNNPALQLGDLGYTAACRRTHHAHRLGVVADSTQVLIQHLKQFAAENATASKQVAGPISARNRSRVAFVYTGMGPQFYGMGAGLLQENVAQKVVEQCDTIWRPLAGWSLKSLFAEQTGQPMMAPKHAQPMNFVLQLMLTEVARTYGLTPEGIVGHSVGEIAAAYISGSLSLEDAISLVYHRSRLMQRVVGRGMMLAVDLSLDEIQPYLKTVAGRVTIAAINSPLSVTVAGDTEAIVWLNELLTMEEILNRPLKVEIAYHSHHMDPLAAEFGSCLQHFACQAPEITLFSSVTGSLVKTNSQDTAYWWRNAREPVRFADAILAMIGDGFDTFVEVGPHPVLKAAIETSLRSAGVLGSSFALQQRTQPNIGALLASVSQIYTSGANLDWSKQYPIRNLITLPTYPWDRETLWSETDESRADRLGSKGHPLLTPKLDEAQAIWEGEISRHVQRYLADHKIQNEAILPGAAFVEMGFIAKLSKGESIAIEGLKFHRMLSVEQASVVRLHLDSDKSHFNIYSRANDCASWTQHASGALLSVPAPARATPLDRQAILSRCPISLDIQAFYQTCDELGLNYGPHFRCLNSAMLGKNEALSRIEVSPDIAHEVTDYAIHPTQLDAALQTLLTLSIHEAADQRVIFLPVEITQIRFQHKFGAAGWCHATLARQDAEGIEGDLVLYDEQGAVSVELLGLRIRALKLPTPVEASKHDLLYKTQWHRQKAKNNVEFLSRIWLVFCDENKLGEQVIKDARLRRVSCFSVYPGKTFKQHSETRFEIARESKEDIVKLLAAIGVDKLDAIVYLWGLDIPDVNKYGEPRLATGTTDTIDLLFLMQEMDRLRSLEGLDLCIATVRAQRIGEETVQGAPGQHTLIGVGRAMAIERPPLKLKMIDLNSHQSLRGSASILDELFSKNNETEVAFREGMRYLPRITPWDGQQHHRMLSMPTMKYIMKASVPGDIDVLEFHEAKRIAPEADEIEIAVQLCAASLPAKNETALSHDEEHSLLDVHVVGTITALGNNIQDMHPGDEVISMLPFTELASFLTIPRKYVVAKPTILALEQCVSLLDWAAAYYMLFQIGKLSQGQSILIHLAETGICQAAVQLARWKGARVFATTGTLCKQAELQRQGFAHVYDAHSLQCFDEIKTLTAQAGVDRVLSSASGAIREKSLGLLCAGGQFIDISSVADNGRATLPLAVFERGIHYTRINLHQFYPEKAQELGSIIEHLPQILLSEEFNLCNKTFAITQASKALEALVRDELIGRVIIDLRDQLVSISKKIPASLIKSEASYLLTGGFSGLGLETLKWLVKQGARQIAVLSRNGPVSQQAIEMVEQCEAAGIRIWVGKVDISDAAQLAEALVEIERALLPLCGVIHSAAIVDDAALEAMDISQLERVMSPKAIGAWNLHHALGNHKLDFFVCYSSITSLLGNFGQINYAAANGFLDGLALARNALGLAGLTINWGVIGDVGMVSRNEGVGERLRQIGLESIDSIQALNLLEEALHENWSECNIFKINWGRWQRSFAGNPQGRFSDIQLMPTGNNPAAEFKRKVLSARPDDRFQWVYTNVSEHICRVLGIHSSRVDAESNLIDLGIDSLMATEVSLVLLEQTGVFFRALFIVRGPTIAKITHRILDELLPSE